MGKLLRHIAEYVHRIQFMINSFGKGPEPLYVLNYLQPSYNTSNKSKFTVKDLIGDGFLWAVPRHRRTVERRLQRKFGSPEYVWKLLKSKTNLKNCNQCGHDHEIGILCPHCYDKVKKETEIIQEKIQCALGNEKIGSDVIVLYEGERNVQSSEFLNGKRVVEMDKPRPMWFSKNLIQKSTQKPTTTKEVKPSDLG